MDRSEARQKYAKHKANAEARGIEFDLKFEEWCEVWEAHWDKRGRGKDQLGMCRTRDQGAYTAGNIRLDTPKGNAGDRALLHRRPWMANGEVTAKAGFVSYASKFPRPDVALALSEEEYEWIPGE
jgi:hypothetical protein